MPERIDTLRRNLRRLVLLNVLALLLCIGTAGYAYYANSRRATEGHQAKRALCEVRADRVAQVAASDKFLSKHPHGIPGIPPSVIRQGRATAQRTVDALAFLNCT